MEQAGVVPHVGPIGRAAAVGIYTGAWQRLRAAFRLDAAVLADAQEDDAVDGHLHSVVQLVFIGNAGCAGRCCGPAARAKARCP